jgi:hypothetical protein
MVRYRAGDPIFGCVHGRCRGCLRALSLSLSPSLLAGAACVGAAAGTVPAAVVLRLRVLRREARCAAAVCGGVLLDCVSHAAHTAERATQMASLSRGVAELMLTCRSTKSTPRTSTCRSRWARTSSAVSRCRAVSCCGCLVTAATSPLLLSPCLVAAVRGAGGPSRHMLGHDDQRRAARPRDRHDIRGVRAQPVPSLPPPLSHRIAHSVFMCVSLTCVAPMQQVRSVRARHRLWAPRMLGWSLEVARESRSGVTQSYK